MLSYVFKRYDFAFNYGIAKPDQSDETWGIPQSLQIGSLTKADDNDEQKSSG